MVAVNTVFPAFHTLLNNAEMPNDEAIDDDLEGEQETLPELTPADRLPPVADKISRWRKSITGASKGITDKTDGDYQRHFKPIDSSVIFQLICLLE